MKIISQFVGSILCISSTCVSLYADEAALKEFVSGVQATIDGGKIGPLGYRIVSTDFEKEPDRQIVVTISATGEIQEIRARLSEKQSFVEWSVIYREGLPVVAQLKKWKKIMFEGEPAGEGLVSVETFVPQNGIFEIVDSGMNEQLKGVIAYAEEKRLEMSNSGQPMSKPMGGHLNQPEGDKPKE